MNLLRILNLLAMLGMIFNTYLWTLSLIHVYNEHPSQDVQTIFLAFFLLNILVWIVLIVNVVMAKEEKNGCVRL